MASEPTLYSDKKGVRITPSKAAFGSRSYTMNDIISATSRQEPPRRVPGVMLAVLSLIVLPVCIAFGSVEGIIICFMVLVFGIIIALTAKPIYHVRISSASGEVNATSSEDKQYIDGIISALNEAIIRRG